MIPIGQTAEVKGSGAKPYVLKNVDGRVYTCSCPAWRNAGGDVVRTCKHLRKVLGDAHEDARTAHRGQAAPAPATPAAPAQPHERARISAEDAQAIVDRAAAEGRKLRPDEKTKLNGPPVLLAHKLEDVDVDPTGWWWSEKLDGVRAWWDGSQFVSRQGNVFSAPDWFTRGLPSHKLDGELWMGRKKFQQTLSVVRQQTPHEGWREVRYVCYDAPDHGGPFEERYEFLKAQAYGQFYKAITQSRVVSRAWLLEKVREFCAAGAEGLMIRKPGSLYEAGKSDTLLKVKLRHDAEAVVVEHVPGKGKHKGRLGGLTVRMPDGKTFNVGTGFSDDDRRSPPPVGATVTYSFTELTDGGIPKCAAFVCVRDYE